ncbi:L-aspartate oxidase [Aquabacterium sp. A7-Y]|uniref:L-aspartate oxidase n=1 Tax=Aquabacterium sp. A7-Y TaxID=1349605 RepID=UPI00223D56D6|nr:L-aspartate oxidase [Aquabacterium sp. A7-Y]MCW7539447.1 L-aspartate oxidase [Aquabacterium sp. A7-Y]
MKTIEADVLVVGGGLAGLTVALELSKTRRVTLVRKDAAGASASQRAQGGISAVYSDTDTHDKHIQDTIVAGAYLNDVRASRTIIEQGRDAIEWLLAQGVDFTRDGAGFHLTREGGHSERRILHKDDSTGAAIVQTLEACAQANDRLRVLDHHRVIKLLRGQGSTTGCAGAIALDANKEPIRIIASDTVLATGGAGQIFLHATAPGASTGDGIALAWDIGCRIANMEFMQFHPTCMYYPQGSPFLITEAVRGEGGLLLLPDGSRFMDAYHPAAELAPRDVVARAIFNEMRKHDVPAVFLSIAHKPAGFVVEHFPNIYRVCLERGIDITKDPIPVTPAAHYTCGGVVASTSGETDVAHLYCIGEAACTGLHGANRLASNSLLECVVTALSAASSIQQTPSRVVEAVEVGVDDGAARTGTAQRVEAAKLQVRQLMWELVGIERSDLSLAEAGVRLCRIEAEAGIPSNMISTDSGLEELRSMIIVSKLVVESARRRKESRGCHYNVDWLSQDLLTQPTVIPPPAVSLETRELA